MELRSHGKFWAIMHLRCPRCHHGRVYASMLKMHAECPVCHLKFEREPGYFSGALFFSFLICAALTVMWFIVLWLLFPVWNDIFLHGTALALTLPMIPLMMRYARVLWMTMDRSIDLTS